MRTLPPINPELVMQRDLNWLKRQRDQIRRFRGPPARLEALCEALQQRLDRSQQQRARRESALPTVTLPDALPISGHAERIVAAIQAHPVVVVAGETGSGKSTQLPKLCLAAGRGRRGLIGCTQPRRIAARSVARRVAEELNSPLGQAVGYQVRFTDRVSPDSYIKFMTDGILLSEIHHDRRLDRYDTLIIDEAHERSLNIDFLLGYLKGLLRRRPDLKLIITSATIDTARIAAHFDAAPVIEVEGRGYPVTIEYQPGDDGEALPRQVQRAVARLSRLDPRGDILVFLPGEREIFQCSRELRQAGLAHTEILPLYARLPAESQDRIFSPGSARRIVLATNVAETSLTVPGIRFVIDSGLARISRYAAHSRVLRLPVEPVSQAACNQRAGRCGRVAPGTCIRLFDEADFLARPDFTEPEIQRAGLIGVVLEMLALGLGDPEDFPFLDPPPRRLLGEAWTSLFELGAVDAERQLTALGRQLARTPIDARFGRMLIEAAERGALAETLVIVSALSIGDVRERPLDRQQAADQAHQAFVVPESDFLGLLKLWQWWQATRAEHSRSQADRLAREAFLSPQRLHEWGQLHAQMSQIARAEGWPLGRLGGADEVAIHRSLLAGLLGQIGQHQTEGEYHGTRGHKFRIFPGSVLARKRPGWLMAAELVETGRSYARSVAPVAPTWLEHQAGHLIKRRVFDPHWDRRSGRVMGYEQLSLHGLVLVEKRRTHYGPHDPAGARRVFILHALVRGEIHHQAEFLSRNRSLRDELAEHEQRRRRRDILAAEAELEAFFDRLLPADVFTTQAFGRWYQSLGEDQRAALLYDRATLLRESAELAGQAAFPDHLLIGQERFRLDYHFDPADPADGITLNCPLHLLNRLAAGQLEWLVPGLLQDKVTALIASLPKSKRRGLVPAAEFARAAVAAMGAPEGDLLTRLSRELSRMSGLGVEPKDYQFDKLPRHLRMNIRIRDEGGQVLGESRDLNELVSRFAERARREFMARQTERWQRDGLSRETLDPLPELVTTRGGHQAWPAWVAQGPRVGVRLFDRRAEAMLAHHDGVAALLNEALVDKRRYLARHSGLSRAAQLAWTRIEDIGALIDALHGLVLRGFLGQAWLIRDREALDRLLDKVRQHYIAAFQTAVQALQESLLLWHDIQRHISALGDALPRASADISSQLDDLMYAGFLADLAPDRLAHYPRYLKAIKLRLNALELDPVRDARRMDQVGPWWQRYLDWLAQGKAYDAALDRYRWMLEEYRVQCFAQHLGTEGKVSEARLGTLWKALAET